MIMPENNEWPLAVAQDDESYKRGIIDGLRMAKDSILKLGNYNNTSDYVWAKADCVEVMDRLIKQHEGEK
jgi:hypothetical protein